MIEVTSMDLMTHLGRRLYRALDQEREAILNKDEVSLAGIGNKIDRLLRQIRKNTFAGNTARVMELIEGFLIKRNENQDLLEESFSEMERELGDVRRQLKILRAYGSAVEAGEMFVKKDC